MAEFIKGVNDKPQERTDLGGITRITRDRHLTDEEAEKYRKIREQVDAELPALVAQRDWRVKGENLNPFKEGTKEFAEYDAAYLAEIETEKREESGICNCGAQDGAEHRPHKSDCNVYKK